MLEESKENTASTKWSKTVSIFEDDDRFKAMERPKDREDLFDDYIMELETKERLKALEEHKKKKKEYIEFLKSCNFLTLVFDELLDRAREKEEKEAKRSQRVADDFYISLTTSKDRLENCFCMEESYFKKHIAELKKPKEERKHREDKAKGRDRRSGKSRRDKDSKGKSSKRRRDKARDSHRHNT